MPTNPTRLDTVTFDGHSAHYTYHTDSSLLDGLSLRRNGAEVLRTDRAFDFLQRLTATANNQRRMGIPIKM